MSIRVTREIIHIGRSPEPDTEIFAFGDVHGRSDLLRKLMAEAAAMPRLAGRRIAVFLGDLVDRGPNSLGAVDMAMGAGPSIDADECIALMGNHEALMRMALDPETDPATGLDAFATWMRNGGDRTVSEIVERGVPVYPDELQSAARAGMPARFLDWLRTLRSHWRSGGMLFVHAGVHPQIPLEPFLSTAWNTPLELLDVDAHWAWIRWPFLEYQPGYEGRHGYFVVHGHTPNDGSRSARHGDQAKAFRLNLDGGSGITGVCKMGYFRGEWVEVISAFGPTNQELALDA